MPIRRDLHSFLDLSSYRNVYIFGDLHGEIDKLEEELDKVCFDEQRDIVISVGDLIDRGPYSLEALELIKKPFFKRVLGNHDMWPRWHLDGIFDKFTVREHGGDWYIDLPDEQIEEIACQLEDAPASLTVLTPGRNMVGIVHADCYRDWDQQVESLGVDSKRRTTAIHISLESRETVKWIKQEQEHCRDINPEAIRVANIDHVFHGHCVTNIPVTIANRSWIDTGACKGGLLTFIHIDNFIAEVRGA